MSNSYDKLKEIGVDKIHQRTHMSVYSIEAILNKSFDRLDKVQFNGFVSLLEKVYSLDLSDIKEEYEQFSLEQPKKESKVKLHQKAPHKFDMSIFVKAAAITLIVIILVFIYNSRTKDDVELEMDVVEVNHTSLNEPAQESILVLEPQEEDVVKELTQNNIEEVHEEINDENQSVDEVVALSSDEPTEEKMLPKELVIKPINKVWIGVIDRETGSKKQTVTAKEYVLDATKDQLIALGHGKVDIVMGDKTFKPNTIQETRFSYIDGELNQIDIKKFKELNKGRLW